MALNTEMRFATSVTDEALDHLIVSVSLFLLCPSLNAFTYLLISITSSQINPEKYISFILE